MMIISLPSINKKEPMAHKTLFTFILSDPVGYSSSVGFPTPITIRNDLIPLRMLEGNMLSHEHNGLHRVLAKPTLTGEDI
jgi:hypothetical protein